MQDFQRKSVTYRLMLLQNLHNLEKNIKNMKPMVDNLKPEDYSHITSPYSGKKFHLKKLRFQTIDKDNKLLLNKMCEIFSTKKTRAKSTIQKSLNFDKRKRDLTRINEENLAMYSRLKEVQPSIQVETLNNDAKRVNSIQNARYKRNISEFSAGQPKKPMLRPPITPAILSYCSSSSPSPDLKSRKSSSIKRRKTIRSHSTERSSIRPEDPELAYGLTGYLTPINDIKMQPLSSES